MTEASTARGESEKHYETYKRRGGCITLEIYKQGIIFSKNGEGLELDKVSYCSACESVKNMAEKARIGLTIEQIQLYAFWRVQPISVGGSVHRPIPSYESLHNKDEQFTNVSELCNPNYFGDQPLLAQVLMAIGDSETYVTFVLDNPVACGKEYKALRDYIRVSNEFPW